MKPPGKPNLDFVTQRMGNRISSRKSRDFPRLVVSSKHLTPEDAELLRTSGTDDIHKVVDTQEGYTMHRFGIWTARDTATFEARIANLSTIGHSDDFIEAMRMAREKNAWTFRFDDYADTVDDLPLGGYEPGLRMGR